MRSRWRASRALVVAVCIATARLAGAAAPAAADMAEAPGTAPFSFFINPGGTGKIPDALVLGFQLALTL